jgi:3-oxoacyl-[acyl-carrier protein] reductase
VSRLSGKVAVVTGASKGIGAAIAKAFAEAGASVVVNYASDKAGATRVVSEIEAKGGKAVAVHGDVSKAAGVKQLYDIAKESYGRLDVVVNNAGVFKFDALEEVTEKEFHRQFDINVLGPILSAQEAVKHFGPTGGSIINISSVVATNPAPSSVIYSGTKGALDTITLSLARELAPRKIRVNAISPGPVNTEGARTLGIADSEFGNQLVASTPLGRFGESDDIASVAVFLASADAGWITGETIRTAGGMR